MRLFQVEIPVNEAGEFDLDVQRAIASRFTSARQKKTEVLAAKKELDDFIVRFMEHVSLLYFRAAQFTALVRQSLRYLSKEAAQREVKARQNVTAGQGILNGEGLRRNTGLMHCDRPHGGVQRPDDLRSGPKPAIHLQRELRAAVVGCLLL